LFFVVLTVAQAFRPEGFHAAGNISGHGKASPLKEVSYKIFDSIILKGAAPWDFWNA
jgi:hypothetical protein